MTSQYLYLFFLAAGTLTSLTISALAWQHRNRKSTPYFAGMMLAMGIWQFFCLMVSMSQNRAQAHYWADLRYFGLTTMLAFFMVFAIQYTNNKQLSAKPFLIFIFSMPFVTQIIVMTNSSHHLFYSGEKYSVQGILMGLDSIHLGILYWVHTFYSYALAGTGLSLIIYKTIHNHNVYRRQILPLILGAIPPLITSLIDAFLLNPGLGQPLSPLGFALLGLFLSIALFQHQMSSVIPMARDNVIECMSDAMIVLDENETIVDINRSAQKLLQSEPTNILGKLITELNYPWNELTKKNKGSLFAQPEIILNIAGKERFFDLRISPLKSFHQQDAGRIIILRDITTRKQAENQLQNMLLELSALKEELQEQAIRDPLTDLYNRRYLEEIVLEKLQQASHDMYPISVVIMDIDHFKEINDTYGHEAGDLVQKHVANILRKQSRAKDLIFRYGGDEFLVILPSTSSQTAYQYSQRLRKQFEDTSVDYNSENIAVTMSIGIAAFITGKEKPEQVLIAADTALYQAKADGRNCVILSETYAG